MSRYPYIDRNPCIVAAGKPNGDPRANVKNLLQDVKLQDKVDAIKREFEFITKKNSCGDWNKGTDSERPEVFTEIRHCIRKPIPTQIQALDDEIKSTIYDSYWNKALGKSRDPTPGLPLGLKPHETSFGISTKASSPGSWVINPPKKAQLVEAEDRDYHDLYAFSHQNYYPGEQIKRNYGPPFDENNLFGRPSKKEENGQRVKGCLTWFNNDPLSNVSRRLAAVRNRTLPPLGKALDKTGVTDLFPTNHTYGMRTPANFYGVEDLLTECTPSLVRRDMRTFLAYANKLRQNVSKKISLGEINLEELFEEISELSKDNKENDHDCSVHYDCVERIMRRHRIFLDRSNLEPLLLSLGLLTQNSEIKVRDFITFIDKNSPFFELKREHYLLPPEFLNCQDAVIPNEKARDDLKILSMPRAGESTFRLDARRPFYQYSIVNMDNLGQETNARTLISPSIFTQYGLSHRDFLKPRSKKFLRDLFHKIDVTLSEEEHDEIYQEGYDLDQTGGVCIETFRNLLDERAFKAYNRME